MQPAAILRTRGALDRTLRHELLHVLVESHAAPANRIAFYFFFALGAISLILQLYNIAALNAFWPFFVSITVQLLAAMFQFMLMVLRPSAKEN